MTKLRAFPDDKSNVAKIMISIFESVGNFLRKGANAGHYDCLLFTHCFQTPFFLGSLKQELGKGLHHLNTKQMQTNSLPNDKILDLSRLKEFADDNINVTEKLKFVVKREENIVGKGENTGSHNVFRQPLSFWMAKSDNCVVKA